MFWLLFKLVFVTTKCFESPHMSHKRFDCRFTCFNYRQTRQRIDFLICASSWRHKTINCQLTDEERTQERLERGYLLSPQCDSHILACGINQVQGPLGDFPAVPSGDSAHVISTLTHSNDICKQR